MIMFLRKSGLAVLLLLAVNSLVAQEKVQGAMDYLQQKLMEEKWTADDIATLKLKSQHRSSVSGLTHFYFQQEINGIPLSTSWASLHMDQEGKVFHENIQLQAPSANVVPPPTPSLSATNSLVEILQKLNPGEEAFIEERKRGGNNTLIKYHFDQDKSEQPVSVDLAYWQDEKGKIHLCWHLILTHEDDVWEIFLDASSGKEVSRHNWVHKCHFDPPEDYQHTPKNESPIQSIKEKCAGVTPSPEEAPALSFNGQYNIFPLPIESPIYGSRSLKLGTDIIDADASPYGWHDTIAPGPTPLYGYTKGNNVYAYYAHAGTSSFDPDPDTIKRVGSVYVSGNVPWPNNLDFNYNHSLNSTVGTAFIEDAVTNLFAWNNICHDVFYHYGFDEGAGNFQQRNMTGNGIGGDFVRARSQDGSGLNNASFFTPPEPPNGSDPPYMRMYLWNQALPDSILDSDLDNAIIVHEYGHGVSMRLVGGASTNSCLTNFEQGGEGWSDFFGLMFTMKDHDMSGTIEKDVLGEGIRSIGSYVLANPANGDGIRLAHYNHNMDCNIANCNDFTYGDVPNVAELHGVGFIWCTMLWDMTLGLIDTFGYESDIYMIPSDSSEHKGNTRAMNLVVEGLKMTACNPTFPQMRNAILEADTAIYGGANSHIIWAAFARRGLGFSAVAGGVEAFDNPTIRVTKTVDKPEVEVGDTLTYTITVKNNFSTAISNVNISDPISANLFVTSVSDGGSVQNDTVVYPSITSISSGISEVRSFTAEVIAANWTTVEYDNPIEVILPPDFTAYGAWITDGIGNPYTNSTRSWWHLNSAIISDDTLELQLNLDGSKNNHLSFWHFYDLEPKFDGGVVEILDGGNWKDLGLKMKQNGYNIFMSPAIPNPIGIPLPITELSGRRAFSGYSGGWVQTIIDLTGYSSTTKVRFRFVSDEQNDASNCDQSSSGCDGWYLDDFKVLDMENIQNTAFANSAEGYIDSNSVGEIGTIFFAAGALPIELENIEALPKERDILVKWSTLSELNNAGFELQRRSENEGQFEKIAWVEGRGTDYQRNEYQFLDTEVETGIIYFYRLKQVDFSGRFEYSKIVSAVVLDDQQQLTVYPNPVNESQFFIHLNEKTEMPLSISMMNLQGQLLQRMTLPADQTTYKINTQKIPSGIYLLLIKTGGNHYHEKLIIP